MDDRPPILVYIYIYICRWVNNSLTMAHRVSRVKSPFLMVKSPFSLAASRILCVSLPMQCLPSNLQHPSGAPAGLQIHPNLASHTQQCGHLWMDDLPPIDGKSAWFYTKYDRNEELNWWRWVRLLILYPISILIIPLIAKFLEFNKLTPTCKLTMSPWCFGI